MADAKVAGLAKQIREQVEKSDEYDLDNYSEAAAAELMAAAFAKPLDAPHAVRCTFLIGGGKSVRGRYDPHLQRGLSQALHALGFEDDSGASLGSSRCFKMQHDTGRNLKLLHVFPPTAQPDGGQRAGEGGAQAATLDPTSPAYLVLAAPDLTSFAALVDAHAPAYMQRVRLKETLGRSFVPLFAAIDAKLIGGTPLDEAEQAWSEVCSADALAERLGWLGASLKRLVDEGALTAAERKHVEAQASAKLEALDAELDAARAEGKEKRAEKLRAQREALLAARAAAERGAPAVPRPSAAAAAELEKLWVQVFGLRRVQEAAKASNTLLTLEQARQVGQLPELEEAIEAVHERERRWFETDEELRARMAPPRQAATAKAKKAASAASARAAASAGWSTAGGGAKGRGAGGRSAGGGGGGKPGGGFALLGDDSDR